jgi:uncharacterized RDD family membrane protein YckC
MYGGFWKRVCAHLIDSIILMIPMLVMVVLIAFSARMMGAERLTRGHNLFSIFASAGIYLGYMTYFIGSCGQTIGKRVMNLKVVLENDQPVGYLRALGRAFCFWLYTLPLFVGGFVSIVSLIMLILDVKKRSLHDRMCSTVVVDLNG